MKDFRLFDLMDFTMDEDFIRWVYEKKATDETFWNNWLLQNPEKHLLIAEARRILESIKIKEKVVSDPEIQSEVEKLLKTIRVHSEQKTTTSTTAVSHIWWIAAASLITLIGTGWYLLKKEAFPQTKFTYNTVSAARHLVKHSNRSATALPITLEDGSRIELATNSSISYGNKLDGNGTRDVYLSGEASFNVTKNPSHPFRVFANEIVTKVLGTSFTIRSFENDSIIRVTVKTGKVSVYAQDNKNARETVKPGELGGIILTPNQQLVYRKAGQKFQRVLLENPEMVMVPGIADLKTVYEEAPLEKVFLQLSKEYGINIVYDAELLKNCTVTADLTNESFYHKLDLISKAVGARYELIDGQVVIQSSGCN